MKILAFLQDNRINDGQYYPIIGTPKELGGYLGAVGKVDEEFESGVYSLESADALLNECVASNETNQRLIVESIDNQKINLVPIKILNL